MNGKELLDKMSDVDPKLITDADKKPKNKRRMFIGLTSGMATVAAAAVLAVTIGRNPVVTPPIVVTSDPNSGVVSDTNSAAVSDPGTDSDVNSGSDPITSTPTVPPKDPPVIDFSEYGHLPVISSGDYGVHGWGNGVSKNRPTTRSELETHSPWSSDLELKTMPVFKSTSTEADINEMREYVKKAAAALGISESELELREPAGNVLSQLESIRKSAEASGAPKEEIERELERIGRQMISTLSVEGKADGVSLWLYTDYNMKVEFDTPIKLPEGCKLGNTATDDENRAAAEYLAERFKDLLGYEKPLTAKVEDWVNYYCVYEGAGEIEDRIFNYSTKHTVFFPNPDDPTEMEFMWIMSNENCVKLDDYPVYTAEQAEEILKSNKFSDEERMPANAKILKTDLVYTNATGYTVVLPYYEFYAEADGISGSGEEIVCDVYRICAVPDQFIDMQNVDYGVRA